MEWCDDKVSKLRQLWDEGLSSAEIGRRLYVSKNAVVGKAHRLDLPERPSPIRKAGEPNPYRGKPKPIKHNTLPPLTSDARVDLPVPIRPTEAAPTASPAPETNIVVRLPQSAGARRCCWPLGNPGTISFRFCGAAAEGRRPYCEEHCAVAYVRVRDIRGDAA